VNTLERSNVMVENGSSVASYLSSVSGESSP
jgi:hypothetical protein